MSVFPLAAQGKRSKRARPNKQKTEKRAWATGVDAASQKRALSIFKGGNQRYVEGDYAAAIGEYRKALAIWDHPSIRFNMAEALMILDRPVEAHDNLTKSLRFGEDALGRVVHKRALALLAVLKAQLAIVTVSCAEPQARVTLNGELLFVGPGKTKKILRPGRYQVVAQKKGLLTDAKELVALPSESIEMVLQPVEIPKVEVAYKRRWKVWKPYAVAGSGVLLGLGGLFLHSQSSSHADQYADELAMFCPRGCEPEEIPKSTRDLRLRSKRENIAAISFFAVGGVALAAGVTMIILNQPRRVDGEAPSASPTLVPYATPTGGGLSLALPW